jgi:glucosamine-6-phosphate deaminase
MNVEVFPTKAQMGQRAAHHGADFIRAAIANHGAASIIVATGASQFEMLESLVAAPNIDWQRVTAFHLDEYAGLVFTHPASFRGYLWQRFASRLPVPLRAFHHLNADDDSANALSAECRRVGALLAAAPIAVAFVGIGENGHLAFNDPPADFETEEPYIVVELDEACRRQQLGEGWFPTLGSVPRRAISMSVRQILKSQAIVCTVPDERKAVAVAAALEGPVTPNVPASILQTHFATTVFLDAAAASRCTTLRA